MYSETTGSRKTLGDVDVIFHDGIYHLFHLVLPNHDFIAHAVSKDGFNWHRVENSLFIGHPGSWDDSMLWTVHVTPHPFRKHAWRMFYTGLSRQDKGLKQRVGMAESDDLYRWKKSAVHWAEGFDRAPMKLEGRPADRLYDYDEESCYPLGPAPEFYEHELDQGRHWISWRDPFYYREKDCGWLLIAGRVKDGPVVRRGCVALMEEVSANQFEARLPLHHPGMYDDIEVPNLCKLDGEYYLFGSIREDEKIRYWHTTAIEEPWRSYADNVLLAAGNYAGRVCQDSKGWLLWCFYTSVKPDGSIHNLMPPPKRLVRKPNGQLSLRTFEGFADLERNAVVSHRLTMLNEASGGEIRCENERCLQLECESGFQAFVLDDSYESFRLSASVKLIGEGKCGLVFRIDRKTRDGYYLSLDLFKGIAQIRSWGSGEKGSGEEMMRFSTLQQAYWEQAARGEAQVQLLVFGSYIELSIDGRILLSLAHLRFTTGAVGFYVESGTLSISNLAVRHLHSPQQSDEHLPVG
jgi:beta-fructofuranosidase